MSAGAAATRLDELVASLGETATSLRGPDAPRLPPALLDVSVAELEVAGGPVFYARPREWAQLRHEEGGAGRQAPYWASLWPSGRALASALASAPRELSGKRVLELGCGLALPSVVAARAGAAVLATDGASDAIAFAIHNLRLNEVAADVAVAAWSDDGDELVQRGPWDLVIASDVLYTRGNAETAMRLFPRLVAPDGELLLADPGRAGARDFLAGARSRFRLRTEEAGDVRLHRLTPRAAPSLLT